MIESVLPVEEFRKCLKPSLPRFDGQIIARPIIGSGQLKFEEIVLIGMRISFLYRQKPVIAPFQASLSYVMIGKKGYMTCKHCLTGPLKTDQDLWSPTFS